MLEPNPEFERKLANIRESHGDRVNVTDVSEVVQSILTTLRGNISATDIERYKLEDPAPRSVRLPNKLPTRSYCRAPNSKAKETAKRRSTRYSRVSTE